MFRRAWGSMPEIVAQGTDVVATYLDQSARLLTEEMGIIQVMMDAENIPASTKVGAVAAGITTKIEGVEKYVFPPLVEIGSVKEGDEEDSGPGSSVFGYVLIMTTVMALLFVATRSMGDIFEEHNNGMLKRQLATPMGIGMVVAAASYSMLLPDCLMKFSWTCSVARTLDVKSAGMVSLLT